MKCLKKWFFLPTILILVFACACGDSNASSSLTPEGAGQNDEAIESEKMEAPASSVLNGSSHTSEIQTDFNATSLVGSYRYEVPDSNSFEQIEFNEDGSCNYQIGTYNAGGELREGHYNINGNELTLDLRLSLPDDAVIYSNTKLLFTLEESFLILEHLSGDGLYNALSSPGDTSTFHSTTPMALNHALPDAVAIVPPVEGVVNAVGGLNLRAAPSTDAQSFILIDDGVSVTVLGTIDSYPGDLFNDVALWYYVEFEHYTGYVHSDYVILPS